MEAVEPVDGVGFVVGFQFVVQFRVAFLELAGFFEKGFRSHGKELRRVGGAVLVDHRLAVFFALADQPFVLFPQHLCPGGVGGMFRPDGSWLERYI